MTTDATTAKKKLPALKPCPFCGSKYPFMTLGTMYKWTIGCNDCGVRTRESDSEFEAVTAWNRRDGERDPEGEEDSQGLDGIRSAGEVMAEIMGNMPELAQFPEGVPF